TEVGQVHKRGNACRDLDELLLHELALGLVFLFLGREFLLLLLRQIALLGPVLEFLDLLALVDDGLNDVVAERAPALDALHSGHRLGVVQDAAQPDKQKTGIAARMPAIQTSCNFWERPPQKGASLDGFGVISTLSRSISPMPVFAAVVASVTVPVPVQSSERPYSVLRALQR